MTSVPFCSRLVGRTRPPVAAWLLVVAAWLAGLLELLASIALCLRLCACCLCRLSVPQR
jgi:hypothetical protein